ncbi:MAG: hypothetical protein JJU29_01335 [Verrucomicrobia bacterium]|nr:hypothetical protein [Verrucomicrobiota bacterium]MCH8510041.1 hypothetical protein [Kiritimatiellia bacterium]
MKHLYRLPFFLFCLGFAHGQLNIQGRLPVDPATDAIELPDPGDARGGHARNVEDADADPSSGSLYFLNGDSLTVRLEEILADGDLVVTRDDVRGPIQIARDNLLALRLNAPRGFRQEASSRITLTNGDRLLGRILEFHENSLEIETRYAGRISLSAPMVASIYPYSDHGLVYDLDAGDREWHLGNQGDGGWIQDQGQLIYEGRRRSATISKAFESLPENWMMAFELEWLPTANFNISMMSQHAVNANQSWSLYFQGDYIRLNRMENRSQDLGRTQVSGFNNKGKARLLLFVNRNENTITLFVDDEKVNTWNDPGGFENAGDHLIFHGGQSSYRVTSLRIQNWNGVLPGSSDITSENDVMEAGNGDRFSGKLLKIEDGVATFQTEFTTFEAPLERISRIGFHAETRGTARKKAGDVRLRMRNDDLLTVNVDTLDMKELTGDSENFGKISVEREAISGFEFNLYHEDREETLGLW